MGGLAKAQPPAGGHLRLEMATRRSCPASGAVGGELREVPWFAQRRAGCHCQRARASTSGLCFGTG